MAKRRSFFVQDGPREPWHVESAGHCEVMLCGKRISVDAPNARVQTRWGPKKCPDCFMRYQAARA